jgi:hypothetical protein
MNWNSFLIRNWIEREFYISFTDQGVRKLLRRLGFSYTNPTNTGQSWSGKSMKREFEIVKEIERIFLKMNRWSDTIRLYTWFLKGKQKKRFHIRESHWHDGHSGSWNGQSLLRWKRAVRCQVFLSFSEKVIAKYPGEKIVMILDNARIHHAQSIQP